MRARWIAAAATLSLTANSGPGLRRFEAALAAQDSATAVLDRQCAIRHPASPSAIHAERSASPPPRIGQGALSSLLGLGPEEPVTYRHVRLICGASVLSEAQNWYLPTRLPPEVNRQLETTDTPFGKALAPWHFTRRRLASQRGRAFGCPAGTILSQRSLLELPQAGPVSYVIECYTRAIID